MFYNLAIINPYMLCVRLPCNGGRVTWRIRAACSRYVLRTRHARAVKQQCPDDRTALHFVLRTRRIAYCKDNRRFIWRLVVCKYTSKVRCGGIGRHNDISPRIFSAIRVNFSTPKRWTALLSGERPRIELGLSDNTDAYVNTTQLKDRVSELNSPNRHTPMY